MLVLPLQMSFCQDRGEYMGRVLLENISRTYMENKGALHVLDDVTLKIEHEQFVCLVGPSGCGKSTLLRILCGIETPDQGRVLLDGKDITGESGHIAYMPQKDLLFPWRTVQDNVIVGLEVAGVSKVEARKQAQVLITEFGLEGFENAYPYALSGGMRQRAAFLRTVLQEKDVMALDEPFGALDALTRRKMQTWLMSVLERIRASVVLVTHDVEEALLLSDVIYILSERPARIELELEVPLQRPRKPQSVEFIELKHDILSILLGERG